MKQRNTAILAGVTAFLKLLPTVLGHENHGTETGSYNHNTSSIAISEKGSHRLSYFRVEAHGNVIIAHIALMTLSWGFILPIAVMLGIARSRFHLLAQVIFFIANAFALFLGVIFRRQTPDLYENEKHSPIGWVSSCVVLVWIIVSIVTTIARRQDKRATNANTATMGMSWGREEVLPSNRPHWLRTLDHGGEGSFESLLNQSDSPSVRSGTHESDNDEDIEKRSLLGRSTVSLFLSSKIDGLLGFKRTLAVMNMSKIVFDRIVLLFGFLCIVTGAVVYEGIFRGNHVFNGLAHFIKGGIFFWYGLLTFGRWTGCLADFGWAWNKKPAASVVGRWPARMPSAEFFESAVICLYGVSNVWLEHLSNPGGKWAARDLEHVSITLMFFGGGLLGMLIESTTIRGLLMTTIRLKDDHRSAALAEASFEEPEQWRIPMNPVPALLIFLLGLMMGAHSQASMVSTMLHKQWGNLFIGFSLARLGTYALLYLKVPRSYLPQRPPTEIITSFCLMAGGLMLMLSNKDTVEALEENELDAMFVFNVVMGFTAFLMAWAAVCLAIKGLAQRREAFRAEN